MFSKRNIPYFAVVFSCLCDIVHLQINKDYCSFEEFSPICQEGEVIMIQKALYGLMKKGKCVVDDLQVAHLGCSSNQLEYIDRECSGLKQCKVDVHNKEMKDKIKTSCPEPYLEASYFCQKVLEVPNKCTKGLTVDVKTGLNYIANTVSEQSDCGYSHTPWILTAKQGQNINITLVDFAWDSRSPVNWNERNKCHIIYGHILTLESNVVDICGGSQRIRHIYTSSSHQVQVVLQQDLFPNVKFLIQFQAVGCPDLIPPKHAWLKKDGDSIVVGCHTSSQTWQLKCVGNHWIGIIANCTQESHLNKVVVQKEEDSTFSGHHLFAFGIGCAAIIVCCVTITLGVYCIHRYQIKMKSKYVKDSPELYLMPRSTLTTNGNQPSTMQMSTVNPGTMGTRHLLGGHPSINNPAIATLNRGDTESVQYFVLEKPPGYVDGSTDREFA